MVTIEEVITANQQIVTLTAKASEMVQGILAKEDNEKLGLRVYVAGGGRFARLFVGVTPGYLHPGLTGATVDDVAANWAAINDEAGYYVPSTLMDWAGHYLSHLSRQAP